MFKTDILFTGFYGQSNTGDDAFIEVASWGAKNFWNKKDNRFLSVDSKLPKTIVKASGYPFSLPRTYTIQANLLLNNTKAFVYAGGSTIHSKMAESSIRLKALRRKAKTNKLKFGGIGVSVGPFKSLDDEKAVRFYLEQMDFLAVRDQASFDFVNSLDLPYQPVNAFDLAALLPEIYNYSEPIPVKNRKKIIGVSVCPFESIQRGMDVSDEQRRNRMMVDLLKEIDKAEDIHFKFYIINGNTKIGDRSLTHETIAQASPRSYEIVEYSLHTQTIWESIANCDFIISTRLHAAIFACFANTPFILNEYHRKCTDFLSNIAYDDQYRVFNSMYDVKHKASQILGIIYDTETYQVPSKVEEMKKKARLNFTQISF